jgi:DNA-binding NarL/FixJ family response regulator
MTRRSVLIADDHPSVLNRVSDLLSTEFDIVGTVGDGLSAVNAAALLKPDIVILDISMPILNGLDAAARLTDSPGAPPIIVLSVHDDPEFFAAARQAGAQGYVVKRAIAADLLPAIRLVLDGQLAFPVAATDAASSVGC